MVAKLLAKFNFHSDDNFIVKLNNKQLREYIYFRVQLTLRGKGEHAERLSPDDDFLHDDGETVHVSWLSALSAQTLRAQQFRSTPQQVLTQKSERSSVQLRY